MAEGYRVRKRTFDQSPNRIDDEDEHFQQSELQDLPIHDNVTLECVASNSPVQAKSIISVLDQELAIHMAKLKVGDVAKLPEQEQKTQERIKDYREVHREEDVEKELQRLAQLKVSIRLADTVMKLKSPQLDEDSTSVEKLYQLEKELNDGLAKFQINDANKLPERIQQTQERIRNDEEQESEKQMQILTEFKRLTLLNETITELKSTRSVEESSNVMKLSYIEEELINGMANLKVDDVKKLPEKIQQTEERIRNVRDEEAEKQIETLTKSMFMTILNDAITKSKSTQSVAGSSSVEEDSPTRPQEHSTNSDSHMESDDQFSTSEGNKRFYQNNTSDRRAKRLRESPQRSPVPEFFVPLPELKPVRYKPLRIKIQQKYRQLCRWDYPRFPGSEPAHMHRENYAIILKSSYRVTWKPAGKRYMMLIEDKNLVYMLNQGNDLFSVDQIQFPYNVEYTSHLTNTLVDGEVICDQINGSNKASFLINDIIIYNGTNVTAQSFSDRLKLISESIVNIHNNAIRNGFIEKRTQPFRIRTKEFFGLSEIDKLLSREFCARIPYKVEGLYFLPEQNPYRTGKCPDILKWHENVTIDFCLKVVDEDSRTGSRPKKEAHLFLSHATAPFATMRYSSNLQEYDNKIVACYYRDRQWYVYRLRHDRRYPNSNQTAMAVMEVMEKPVTKEDLRDLIKHRSKSDVHEDNSSSAT